MVTMTRMTWLLWPLVLLTAATLLPSVLGKMEALSLKFSDPHTRTGQSNDCPYYASYTLLPSVEGEENVVASGTWDDTIHKIGWARLSVETNASYPDRVQLHSAGYFEGKISHARIADFLASGLSAVLTGVVGRRSAPGQGPQSIRAMLAERGLEGLVHFFEQHYVWLKQQIAANPTVDYWQQAEGVLCHLNGLVLGYNEVAHIPMDVVEGLILNAVEDLPDILAKEFPEQMAGLNGMDPGLTSGELWRQLHIRSLHCSGLIRLTKDELFVSHDTWSSYMAMIRIFKSYTFHLSGPGVVSDAVVFSGYPGILCSMDDFYMTSAGLTVLETTNNIFNASLYAYVAPQTVLCWMRTILANRMAGDGAQWIDVFSKHNSGTYNNQWMIVNYNKYSPGQQLPNGTVYICEQIPGYIESADVSAIVNQKGYWDSYNIPYLKQVFDLSGYPAMVSKYGDLYSWGHCPRANIFRRDAPMINDLEGMQRIMRQNKYQSDPLSKDNPAYAISSRFDLESTNPFPFGGIDSKVTSSALALKMSCLAVAGPTHESLPPFAWSLEWDIEYPHMGMPTTFDFNWQPMPTPSAEV